MSVLCGVAAMESARSGRPVKLKRMLEELMAGCIQITSELLFGMCGGLAEETAEAATGAKARSREERMKSGLSRRDFNRLAAAGVAAGALGGLTSRALAETRLRLIWWGNPDRDKRTNAVVDLYKQANAEVTIDPETYAWNDYWPKLATQAAGQNLPDVIQMDYRYIFEYARRGQLADLTPFVGKQIDLGDFDPNQLESGKVDGKLYGISLGANSMTHVYKADAARTARARRCPIRRPGRSTTSSRWARR